LGSVSLSTRLTTMMSHQGDDPEDDGDVLGTPGAEKKRWGGETAAPEAPSASNRAKRTKGNGAGGGVTLTLRDQEKVCVTNILSNQFNHNLKNSTSTI